MPQRKRGFSVTSKQDASEVSPPNSPRRQSTTTPRGARGVIESPSKSQVTAARKHLTSEDVRAEASPIVPRGRGRPPLHKTTATASKISSYSDASPSRRSRRLTEQAGDEEPSSSSRPRTDSQSSMSVRRIPSMSPMTTSRRGRKSEMEPHEPSEGAVFEESEGRGKRKRKLTEAAEASQAQSRSRRSSRRISERTEQHLDAMEPIHEELTEPTEEEVIEEVAHEEMVHAVSPQEMFMQPHLRPYMMGTARTRGMHIVSDHDELLNEQLVEEDDAMEEMEMYDEEGNLIMGYEDDMAHEEIVEGEEVNLMGHHDSRRQPISPHEMKEGHPHILSHEDARGPHEMRAHEVKEEPHQQDDQEEEDDDSDDDQPPRLEPEEGPEEELVPDDLDRGQIDEVDYEEDPRYIQVQSPGGTQYYQEAPVDEAIYMESMDEEGIMELEDEGEETAVIAHGQSDLPEFNFLDNKHVCCGMCGEIVPYDNLLSEHLPLHHPEIYEEGGFEDFPLTEVHYENWLTSKLRSDRRMMENGFRTGVYNDPRLGPRTTRPLRRVSQVRVNPSGMSLQQLDEALKKKMVEKMGRKVKVSLVDKQHARCGICNAVVSLNKKFEVVHLVRHFNAWHPSAHRCAGSWPNPAQITGPGKPLSCQDFAVVDVALDAPESLQCIWCGMFMDRTMLAMHFHEVHSDDVEVPKCHLCLQEIVINARLLEKFGEDFEIVLPDEHHIRCQKIQGNTFSTEAALDRCIERRLRKMQAMENGDSPDNEEDEAEEEDPGPAPPPIRDTQYSNSRMNFGRRNKPKRNFVMPSLRQAIPQDSRYVEALNEGEWRCKMCGEPILAAVISAGAIKHYRLAHPELLQDMQYELCKARLERVSDGCMEFVHPSLVECLICNLTYALHKPYNMCRGIRHLKTKHPEMMPEYNSERDATNPDPVKKQYKSSYVQQRPRGSNIVEFINDPVVIRKFKEEYDIEFDKVQSITGPDGQQVFVLVPEGQEIDATVAQNIHASMIDGGLDGEEQEEGGGVIVEEEAYQMDDEMMVREEGDENAAEVEERHEIEGEEVVEEEGEVPVEHPEGEEVHDEMGEEREGQEDELEEQEIPEEQQDDYS